MGIGHKNTWDGDIRVDLAQICRFRPCAGGGEVAEGEGERSLSVAREDDLEGLLGA